MAETLAALVAAHLLGDFVFQPDWMMRRKRRPSVLVLHVAVVTTGSFLLLGNPHWPILSIVFFTHLGLDAVKVFGFRDTLQTFLVDQLLHAVVIVALALVFPGAADAGWWRAILTGDQHAWYRASLALLCGLILAVPAGGVLVAKCIDRFMNEIGADEIAGLERGGLYIGWLERSLVLLLVLIDQPAGIGFLIAAKSILRFGEIKDASQRKVAEYIIIGTFLSFGWALLVAVVTRNAIGHWLPAGTG